MTTNLKKTSGLPHCIRTSLRRVFFLVVLAMSVIGTYAQVSGTVEDVNKEPIIGASVVVKGTSVGTVTDLNGKFTIPKATGKSVLQISYVGYVSQTVSVGGRKNVVVVLEEDKQLLDEVVVVGYGSMKKSDLTGAMSRVTSKTIEERPVQNVLQAMQGKTPGVDIALNNRPGELGDVRVRSNRSLLADNDPLYVIDGIPLTAGSMADRKSVV